MENVRTVHFVYYIAATYGQNAFHSKVGYVSDLNSPHKESEQDARAFVEKVMYDSYPSAHGWHTHSYEIMFVGSGSKVIYP